MHKKRKQMGLRDYGRYKAAASNKIKPKLTHGPASGLDKPYSNWGINSIAFEIRCNPGKHASTARTAQTMHIACFGGWKRAKRTRRVGVRLKLNAVRCLSANHIRYSEARVHLDSPASLIWLCMLSCRCGLFLHRQCLPQLPCLRYICNCARIPSCTLVQAG